MNRFNVVTVIPKQMRDRGFVAYVNDSTHPDGGGSCSMSWHLTTFDADRVAAAMNKVAGCADNDGPAPFCNKPIWGGVCTLPTGHAGDHRCLAVDVDARKRAGR